MRLVRPMVIIDEGHHGYTETALQTIDGFNPCFMLELSATPRVPDPKAGGRQWLQHSGGCARHRPGRGADDQAAHSVDVRRWA
jgi:Type III restriction enzyme, res subunit.